MKRNSLTARLRVLQEAGLPRPGAPSPFTFGSGRYAIRVANDLESRTKAYRLVYRLYLEREYARPHPSKLWLSIFDAFPETTTLLAEDTDSGAAVGALTVCLDSPLGLPADKLYKPELGALRGAGRRIAEAVSLGVAEEAQAGSLVLFKLFNCAYFIARGVRGASDFVITVNPRHVRLYERLLCFAEAGPERGYAKVGGAPAVLLRLCFETAERERAAVTAGLGDWRQPAAGTGRSVYRQFRAVSEEPRTVRALARQLRPMSAREIGWFFATAADRLAEATPAQLALLGPLGSRIAAFAPVAEPSAETVQAVAVGVAGGRVRP